MFGRRKKRKKRPCFKQGLFLFHDDVRSRAFWPTQDRLCGSVRLGLTQIERAENGAVVSENWQRRAPLAQRSGPGR